MSDKKEKRFLTTQTMLEWQYFQIIGELQEIQRHDGDVTCPCRLSEDLGENCLAKHSLGLSVIAAETAAMETEKTNASLLWKLSADAKERHQKIKGFLCHKNDAPEFGDWSRQWRKKFEPLYYRTCKVKLKDEEAALEDATTDKIESQTFGIKMLATELPSACPEHANEKSYTGIAKEMNKRADAIDKIVEDLMNRPTATKPCPPAAPMPARPPAVMPPSAINKTFAMGITTPTRYEFVWKLLESKDLIVSHDPFTFEVNPKFVQALQPRLRDRAATQMQVMNIASKLEPDLLIQDFLSLDKGSPIVDAGNLVLCGNGRVMGIIRAIKENPDRYKAYRARLMELSPRYRFDAAQVGRMKAPVLVRMITTPIDKKAFAEECNASTVIEASPIEKAKTDAEKITPSMLNSIVVLENESIFDAIKAVRNKDFVISFLNKLPPNEQAGLVDAKGVLSQAGTRRIAMAIFVATFKGNVGLTLATKFFESNDPDVLTVFSGITRSLSTLSRAEALIATGDRQPDYAFGEDLAKVVTVYSGIKQTDGLTVPKYLNQQAFDRQLNPFQERVLVVIGDNARSGKRIGAILSAYAQAVIDSPPPSQGGFMAMEPLTKTELWESAVKKATTVDLSDIAELFDKISDRLRAGAEAMQKTIDEKRDPAVSHQNLTARRARQTSNASSDADYLEETQKAMIGLAAAIDAGTAPESLKKITSRAAVDQVLHTRFTKPYFHKSSLTDLREVAGDSLGSQSLLDSLAERVKGEESYSVDLQNDGEIRAVLDLVKLSATKKNKYGYSYNLNHIADGIHEGQRLIDLGLDLKEKFDAAKSALKQYVSGPAPEVLAKKKERELTASLIGQKIPGFFPTPRPVIDRMIEQADIKASMSVLEPSAGKGDIADAIKEYCPACQLYLVELSHTLIDILYAKGYSDVAANDFLTYDLGIQFDRILMNPPFENAQDVDHVKHAFDLLKPGGRLVAIMGEHCFFGSESKCSQFRNWLDELDGSSEKLEGAFTGAESFRQTGVVSRMVVIDKPQAVVPDGMLPQTTSSIIEPWQMTAAEFYESRKNTTFSLDWFDAKHLHKDIVDESVKAGKPVPQNVLDDPDYVSYREPQRLPIPDVPYETNQQIRLFDAMGKLYQPTKWRDAERFIIDVLHERIERPKQAKSDMSMALKVTPATGQRVFEIPVWPNSLTDPEFQRSVWHEIGHYFDEARIRGAHSNTYFCITTGKYSTPRKVTLLKFKEYIQQNRKRPELGWTVNGKKYNCLDEIKKDTAISPAMVEKCERSFHKWEHDIEQYLTQDIEMFADGFAEYVCDSDKMRKEVPEIASIYDNVFSSESRLQDFWDNVAVANGRMDIPETPLEPRQQIRLFDKKEITADDVAQLFASKAPSKEQMGFDFDARPYIEPAPFPTATHCPPICPIAPDVPVARGNIKYTPMPYQQEAYEWLKGKHYALLADEPGVGKTCSAILWAADLRPALVIAPANAVINWAEKEIKGMWRPDDSVILLDGKQDFPKKLPDWVVMSYGMLDKYLDDMKVAGFQSIVVDEAHMVKNMTAKRTQHLLNLVIPDEYEKLRIADLNGETAKVELLEKRIAKLKPIQNRLAVTGTPVLNRPIELFALLMFLGLKQRKDYKEFVETYTISEEGRHGTMWKGAKNLDQLYAYMKPFMLRRYKRDVLKDLPPKVNKSMFVPITNAKEYREAETNFLNWLTKNKGEEAASRAVDAEVIVQMNALRQLAAVGKVQPVADWMKPCSMTGSKMLVFSSFVEPLEELNRIKEPLSALYTGADSKEQRQKVIEQFQHDPALCFFLGTVGAAGVAITLTAADRVAFLDLPWTPGGKIQAEDRAHRKGQTKEVEIYNVLAKGTIDERMLELLSQKEQIIAQAIDGKTIDEATAGSIANSLMQSFLSAPNLSDAIEDYVPDKPDEDMSQIEDEIIQGVMSDSSYIVLEDALFSGWDFLKGRVDMCNLDGDEADRIMNWGPLRDFIMFGAGGNHPVKVCHSGFVPGAYQITVENVKAGNKKEMAIKIGNAIPRAKRVFTHDDNLIYQVLVPESNLPSDMEWSVQEVPEKHRGEQGNQAAMFDKSAMIRSDPVVGKASSVDIPLACGTKPVDPLIRKAIENAEEV